jgi:hypothetical protein
VSPPDTRSLVCEVLGEDEEDVYSLLSVWDNPARPRLFLAERGVGKAPRGFRVSVGHVVIPRRSTLHRSGGAVPLTVSHE